MTKKKFVLSLSTVALCIPALAACSTKDGGSSDSYPSGSPSESTSSAKHADVSTSDTSLGKIVVNGEGMTAYVFDKDKPNATSSSCLGPCADLWPAIETTSATPDVEGVSGKIGTIAGTDGKTQITVDGMPIYAFSKDIKPGDANGQGVKGVWHAIKGDGSKVTSAE